MLDFAIVVVAWALLIMQGIIKTADIGHSCKGFAQHTAWSRKISLEFYSQGEDERSRGMSVPDFMNRANEFKFARHQISFIDFICLPLLEEVAHIIDAGGLLEAIKSNRAIWVEKDSELTLNNSGELTINKLGGPLEPMNTAESEDQ